MYVPTALAQLWTIKYKLKSTMYINNHNYLCTYVLVTNGQTQRK